MKLIIYSIICGFLSCVLSLIILGMAAEPLYNVMSAEDADMIIGLGAFVLTMIGFFSPGLYILNKLYEKSKKENITDIKY